MGLFDAFKKKKQAKPVPELETPPMPEAAQSAVQPAPGFEEYVPAPPQEGMQYPPQQAPQFPQPQFSMQQAQPVQRQQFPQAQFSQYPLPKAPPTAEIPPIGMPQGADVAAQYGEVPEEMPMPTPPEEMEAAPRQEQTPQVTLFGQQEQQPKFKFYYGPEKTAEQHSAELPFDVTQELLHMPKMHEDVIEQHAEEEQEHPYAFVPREQALQEVKREKAHAPKQFITVAMLYEVGEQLVNMGEDLGLAKDTAFRLTDLNELEIEQMVKWQALQQSMEMRVAEIDKLLFKA